MISRHITRLTLLFRCLILLVIVSSIDSQRASRETSLMLKLKSAEYKQLAKYCYIDDYSAWLQRQHEFNLWSDLAKILRLPLDEDIEFQREREQYRLQHECLRVVERLPLSIGPGRKR